MTLQSSIGESPQQADASLSGQFVDLQTLVDYHHVRALFVLGAATGKARYRATGPVGDSIFAKDDNINFRTGAGLGFAPIKVGPVRPAAYLMYVSNPVGVENTVKHRYELGVDIELEREIGDDKDSGSLILGFALTYETGLSYADFMTADTYRSEYATKGILMTLGLRVFRGTFGE